MKKFVIFLLGTLMVLNACQKEESESFNAREKSVEKSPTFFDVEEMPEFPGGDKALRNYVINTVAYPEVAKANGIEGKVYVTFVVEKDGSVGDVKIARGVDASLDSEALRVVENLPMFKPGKQRGQTVRVSYTIPINFELNGDSSMDKKSSSEVRANNNQTFIVVEDMPEFTGGTGDVKKYIADMLVYPEAAKEKRIEGKVYVSFNVEKDGSVDNVKIARGLDPLLDQEAFRVVSELPKWKPGKQRGKPVSVSFTIPVYFNLN